MTKYLLLVVITLSILTTLSTTTTVNGGSKYLEQAELKTSKIYGFRYWSYMWLNNYIVGFPTGYGKYISYINLSSGEPNHLYLGDIVENTRSILTWFVNDRRVFIVNSTGYGFLLDIVSREIIWSNSECLNGANELYYYGGKIVLVNNSSIQILNVLNGEILHRITVGNMNF